MLRASVRMVCIPSASCRTSSGVFPCTIFQYCEDTIGMLLMPKYLFSWSTVAVAPPLRQLTIEAAGLLANRAPRP